MIDISKEQIHLKITPSAIEQVELIKTHDFTMENLVFRLKIGGKGCHGFDYTLGFSEPHSEDLEVIATAHDLSEKKLTLNIDPFTAFYCREGLIDYICDYENNTEGFHFENNNQKEYRGKFFKNESKTPKTTN
jgi:Fe-S cluster assembly iron-binding protein IscA